MTTGTKIVPLVSSGTAGPLGVMHLPRLWSKLTLHCAGVLAEGYDSIGPGFDSLTLNDLGLNKDEVMQFIKTQKPTYPQFEEWVLQKKGGHIDPAVVKKHNEAILGYNHSGETAQNMRSAMGVKRNDVSDAVTLNTLDDLHELYKSVVAG
ncbi:MAG: DUF5069 domain-containing protein [Candidatus Eremiobacteraeota bacterium]|nr:DUF5069 domain-containing protein [Candidatus Eremiobacteraeota bacterium]MBC5826467.1 DUF5069 domain-containing protein [Candidatus Eremiobacteraeota bacterium]